MRLEKIPLNPSELPVVIENSFPKLSTSSLILTKLENTNKLRPLLCLNEEQPTITSTARLSDLERTVVQVLEKSKEDKDDGYYDERDSERGSENDSEHSEADHFHEDHDRKDSERGYSERDHFREDSDSERVHFRDSDSERVHFREDSESDHFRERDHDEDVNERGRVEEPIPPKSEKVQPKEDSDDDDEEDEIDEKTKQAQLIEERGDILWSLKKLKRYHDIKSFPHYDEFTPLNELKRILKEVKREAILDENVSQTRQYITMVWFAVEKVCTEYLSIDLSGFTAYETQHMNEYQKVLIEIGERSYLNWSEGFPPELKLLYLMLTHAALFHVKKTTTNLTDLVNILDPKKQGEMRGPSKIL
jgi:AAA ATPase containing von Willebrand factor type A (vWA) domain